jgi:hypothetical protein
MQKWPGLLLCAILLSSCGGSADAVCTYQGGEITKEEAKAMRALGYTAKEAREQALMREILPLHADDNGYNITRKEARLTWDGWVQDYYGGDEDALSADAKKQGVSVETIRGEVIYQTLLDLHSSRYPVGEVTQAQAKAWYRKNTYSSGDNIDTIEIIFADEAQALAAYRSLSSGKDQSLSKIQKRYPSARTVNIRAWDDEELLAGLRKIKPGDWSKIQFSPAGWYLYGVRGPVKASYNIPYNQVSEQVAEDIINERYQAKLGEIRESYQVECQ